MTRFISADRLRMHLVVITLVAGLVTTRSAPAAAQSAEDSVRALETARREAVLHADTVALSRLLATEFYEVSRLGTLRSRADNIRDLTSGVLHLTSIRYDSTSVRIYDNTAVLTAISDNAGTFRGQPFSGKVRYTRVFVRRDGRWQGVMMQQTPIP